MRPSEILHWAKPPLRREPGRDGADVARHAVAGVAHQKGGGATGALLPGQHDAGTDAEVRSVPPAGANGKAGCGLIALRDDLACKNLAIRHGDGGQRRRPASLLLHEQRCPSRRRAARGCHHTAACQLPGTPDEKQERGKANGNGAMSVDHGGRLPLGSFLQTRVCRRSMQRHSVSCWWTMIDSIRIGSRRSASGPCGASASKNRLSPGSIS